MNVPPGTRPRGYVASPSSSDVRAAETPSRLRHKGGGRHRRNQDGSKISPKKASSRTPARPVLSQKTSGMSHPRDQDRIFRAIKAEHKKTNCVQGNTDPRIRPDPQLQPLGARGILNLRTQRGVLMPRRSSRLSTLVQAPAGSAAQWDELPAEVLHRILTFLMEDGWMRTLLLGAMSSSKLWRDVALAQTRELTFSLVHEGRLMVRASQMGSWSLLHTLRLGEIYEPREESSGKVSIPAFRKVARSDRRPKSDELLATFGPACGFTAIDTLHINDMPRAPATRRVFAAVLKPLSNLTALDFSEGELFVDACVVLSMPSLRGRFRHLRLAGIRGETRYVREKAAMVALGKLPNLESLALQPGLGAAMPGCDGNDVPLRHSLRRMHLGTNLELDVDVDDGHVAAVMGGYTRLETLVIDHGRVTGEGIRSNSLTALSLHNCLDLTPEGLEMMVGALPALAKLAITSPSFLTEVIEVEYEPRHLLNFVASCHSLIELRLDELVTQDPDEEGYVAPILRPYSLESLQQVEAGCRKLESLVVIREPLGEAEEGTTLYEMVTQHLDMLPLLARCVRTCKKHELTYEGAMELPKWADDGLWVDPHYEEQWFAETRDCRRVDCM